MKFSTFFSSWNLPRKLLLIVGHLLRRPYQPVLSVYKDTPADVLTLCPSPRLRQVTEYWLNETYLGWCNSKLINSTVAIKFLGSSPQLYKPGMPFVGQVGPGTELLRRGWCQVSDMEYMTLSSFVSGGRLTERNGARLLCHCF